MDSGGCPYGVGKGMKGFPGMKFGGKYGAGGSLPCRGL